MHHLPYLFFALSYFTKKHLCALCATIAVLIYVRPKSSEFPAYIILLANGMQEI